MVLLENRAVFDIRKQAQITVFMLLFSDDHMLPYIRDRREALLAGLRGKCRIQVVPFIVFAGGGFDQVGAGVADHAGRKARGDFQIAAFEELEEPLRVLLLLIGGFGEDVRNLHIPLFFRLAGEEGVAVAGLRFAGEGFQQVLFGFGSFDGFHHTFSSGWL